MKAYSQDLRIRIVEAVQQTHNQSQVATTFKVSRSTVVRLLKLHAQDPNLPSKTSPGRSTEIASQDYPALLSLVAAKPDTTLDQLAHKWAEGGGERVSTSTLSRLLRRLGWTRKKRVWQPPSENLNKEPSL